MKISAQQYAAGLALSLVDKSEAEISVALDNFVQILSDNRETNRLSEILAALAVIWNKEAGEVPAEVESARSLTPEMRQAIESYLLTKTGAKKILLTEKVSPEILGGFVVRYEDKVVDASLKTAVWDLKESMKK
jgi:F-type H+-transporting ATPase subunit delta